MKQTTNKLRMFEILFNNVSITNFKPSFFDISLNGFKILKILNIL